MSSTDDGGGRGGAAGAVGGDESTSTLVTPVDTTHQHQHSRHDAVESSSQECEGQEEGEPTSLSLDSPATASDSFGSRSPSVSPSVSPSTSSSSRKKHSSAALRRKIKAAHRKLNDLLESPRGRKVIESEKARHNWSDEQVIEKLKESVQQSIVNAYEKQQQRKKQKQKQKKKREGAAQATSPKLKVPVASEASKHDDAVVVVAVEEEEEEEELGDRSHAPPFARSSGGGGGGISRQASELPSGEESQFLNAALELMDEQSKTAEDMNTLRHEVAQLLEQMEKLKSLPTSITGCVAKVNEALDRCQQSHQTVQDDGHAVASGWLIKDGGHTLSTDKTRWAIVNPPYMVYYKTVDRSTVKGILFLDRCRFEQTPNGFVLHAVKPGLILNPLHTDKGSYRFTVPNPDDRQWWNDTMRSALAKARRVQSILRWQQRFDSFTDIADYRHLVHQCLCASGSPSSLTSSQTSSPVNENRKSLRKSYSSPSSLVAIAAAEEDAMDGLTNSWRVDLRWLRNFKNDPILSQQKMFDEIAAPRIRTPRTPKSVGSRRSSNRLSKNFTTDQETLTNMVETICRRFEVSWDHRLRPLGLDSTMKQVRKDTPRDSFCINGETFERIQGDELVNILVQQLLSFRETSAKLAGEAASHDTSHKSAQALRFARCIVLGSTRTISGGDAYDAVDLLFRNRDLVILCPVSGRESRVEITFQSHDRGAQDGGSGGGGGGAAGAEEEEEQSDTLFSSPPRSRMAPSISRSRGNSLAGPGPAASDFEGLPVPLWPRVNVKSSTFYRLRDCDGDGDVAVAEAIFRRKFLSDGTTNGSITVVLHSPDEEIEQPPPSPVRGKPRTRQNSVIL